MKDLLQWDRMLSTALIKGFYLFGLAFWGLTAVGLLFACLGLLASHGMIAGLFSLLFCTMVVVGGVIVLRVLCEQALVFFLIHENLVEIRNAKIGISPSAATPSAAIPQSMRSNSPLGTR